MKTQLIILPDNNIIVCNEKTLSQNGDYYLGHPAYNTVHKWNMTGMHEGKSVWINKIIAGIPELPSIDYSQLSEDDCKKIGYVDVAKIAELWSMDYYSEVKNPLMEYKARITQRLGAYIGFQYGFQKAQSLNDKKYSEEDLRRALDNYELYIYTDINDNIILDKNQFNKFLNQPKIFDIEVEIEKYPVDAKGRELKILPEDDFTTVDMMKSYDKSRPKITNNSIKITKVL